MKRKSDNIEYYQDTHDFESWTRVDLTELSRAPFANPSNDPKATHFQLFLEDQVKKGFTIMKTAESFIKQYPDVIDQSTNLPFKNVMWPATKQMSQVPVLQNFQDRSLEKMLNWVYDEKTATTVINFQNGSFRLFDKNDLLQFGRWDIHHLSLLIQVAEEIFECAAKEYTSKVAEIIEKEIWSGAMDGKDVVIVDKD